MKTGQYYLRAKPSVDAIKFTLNIESMIKAGQTLNANMTSHMSTNNKSEAEMKTQGRRKKRMVNEISNNTVMAPVPKEGEEAEDKKDEKKSVKECAFNFDGSDECFACGS
jgi:L,D-peptidoglycan transpeptidase YkuD (ErfK/YbiS/YcfS/YnhG family)